VRVDRLGDFRISAPVCEDVISWYIRALRALLGLVYNVKIVITTRTPLIDKLSTRYSA
jgi:hypothetical protein